ncbi:hypothetical protein SETIT_3G293500v2 [Setaria italica]|uniref:Uncharacterized protein n=1 Tax=Setaria italica TaxID=4555 RepID=A0A368QKK3_SETIT|nr:hypothetical protein SETIT_3G293500v2 [Setaria italica]
MSHSRAISTAVVVWRWAASTSGRACHDVHSGQLEVDGAPLKLQAYKTIGYMRTAQFKLELSELTVMPIERELTLVLRRVK